MARGSRGGNAVLENENTDSTATEADEAAVYTGTDGAEEVQPETEAADTETTEGEGDGEAGSDTEAKAEPDLTAFTEVVEAAVKSASTDGAVTDEASKTVTEAYRALSTQPDSRKAYRLARELVEERMKSNLLNGAVREAVAYMNLQEALVHGTGTPGAKAERKPADPLEDYVTKLVTVELAASIVASEVPEGVDPEKASEEVGKRVAALSEKIDTYRTWLDSEPAEGETKPDAPEVDPLLVRAFKVARGRGAKVSSTTPRAAYAGERRNVGTHISQVFFGDGESNEGVEVGTFLKVSAIAKSKTKEYGDDAPSAGAINAAIKRTKGLGIDGLEVAKDDNGALGVRRVA